MMNHPNVKVIERQALTPRDVSIAYGVTEGTLANWRHKRIGPRYYKLGSRKVAYFKKDLDEWAKSNPVMTRDSIE